MLAVPLNSVLPVDSRAPFPVVILHEQRIAGEIRRFNHDPGLLQNL